MTDVKIIENVIPKGYADQLEEDLLRMEFPWYYINDVTSLTYGDNSGFAHVVYEVNNQPSNWYPFIKPLVYNVAEAAGTPLTQLFRIRIGFLQPSNRPDLQHNSPHVDFFWPHRTACYYVNDSDGDTVLFDQRLSDMGSEINEHALNEYVKRTTFTEVARSSPCKGSVCVFDGTRFHASTKPQLHQRRLVITINYI